MFWVNVRPNQTRVREQPDTGYRKYRLSYFAASPGCGGGAGAWGRERDRGEVFSYILRGNIEFFREFINSLYVGGQRKIAFFEISVHQLS